jgi:S1-C subfamily serine protease
MESVNPLLELSNELARAVEIGEQAVAAVHGRPHVPSSGIIWRAGVIVTTDHTLKRDEDLTVTLPDGRNLPASLAGRDGSTDIAVLRLADGQGDAAKTVSDASIKTGNVVLALGRRGANGVSASFGVISAISGAWRTWRGGEIERFIRPDINIYTGFSGGALVDVLGRVIGLNTSGLTRGMGVTIPASTVSRVVDELLSRGHVRRGFLGVGLHPVVLPGDRQGLVILSIEPNGPANQAGIVVGDVLLTLAGTPVSDTDAVQSHLGSESVGKPLAAGILRGGTPLNIQVTPAERPVREG